MYLANKEKLTLLLKSNLKAREKTISLGLYTWIRRKKKAGSLGNYLSCLMSSNSNRENSDSRGFDNKEIILFIWKKPSEEDIQEQCINFQSALLMVSKRCPSFKLFLPLYPGFILTGVAK